MYLGAPLIVVTSLIQHTAGLFCDSGCAACWRDGDKTGKDIKFQCYLKSDTNKENSKKGCGTVCPEGFSGMHCAKWERCTYVYVDLAPLNALRLHTQLCTFYAISNSSNPGSPIIDVQPIKLVLYLVRAGAEQKFREAPPSASMRQKTGYVGPHKLCCAPGHQLFLLSPRLMTCNNNIFTARSLQHNPGNLSLSVSVYCIFSYIP